MLVEWIYAPPDQRDKVGTREDIEDPIVAKELIRTARVRAVVSDPAPTAAADPGSGPDPESVPEPESVPPTPDITTELDEAPLPEPARKPWGE